jgi:pyruvate formate lyase activating enzyme
MAGTESLNTIKETQLYEKIGDSKVKCGVCERRCVIENNRKGFCGTKQNFNGKLCTIVYGDISALESRPIEIKPFFHYYPASTALTFSTWSCNFRCPWCQNHHLSRTQPDVKYANYISPQDMVKLAQTYNDDGLCISFQEPLMLFEYSLDVFPIARTAGLYSCYVSNGYLTYDALKMLCDAGLTGLKIDIKGDAEVYEKYCLSIDYEKIWLTARNALKLNMHVELVNLIITDVNDDDACILDIINRTLKFCTPYTPLHFTRYYPAYKFSKPATKVTILERAYELAMKNGIKYPYLGNVTGHKYENTYCHECGTLLIKRFGTFVSNRNITANNKCMKCGIQIPITGRIKQ